MTTINKQVRWKGAGMGEYYCSLCCEVGDIRERECPNCHAQMYTDEEWAKQKAWWALEDSIFDTLPNCCRKLTEENNV